MSETGLPNIPPQPPHINMRLEDRLAEAVVAMDENADYDAPFDLDKCRRYVVACRRYIDLQPKVITSGSGSRGGAGDSEEYELRIIQENMKRAQEMLDLYGPSPAGDPSFSFGVEQNWRAGH